MWSSDIAKGKQFKRVGDVMVQRRRRIRSVRNMKSSSTREDSAIQKKDRTVNEPVTFLVGHERLRYELVVNYVDKDRIRGYVSSPKDRPSTADTLRAMRAL
jgi:hypothetical protein